MRRAITAALSVLALIVAAHTSLAIEMTWEYSVQVSATVQPSPAQITLNWPQDQYTTPNSYTIYRKDPSAGSWGTGITLPGTSTSYVDRNVVVGAAYEYQVVKVTSQYTGYGYVYSGINLPMTEYRGKLLLVLDNTYAAQLAADLQQLQQDLAGDGWTVIRLDVNRNDSVASVKSRIQAQYSADPANVKSVFLFGHVPIPYSGNIVPDGHTPDHHGAWPADGFYGDMDGIWTDNSVSATGQYDPRNSNAVGDGKFDQNTFPAPVKLMVGRVDLANMPGALWTGGPATFPSEFELLRNYLNKLHKFRTKQFDLPRQGIVGDFFGVRNGEAFAASAWRNFAPFFGANNITMTPTQGTWTPTLASTGYLWSYGAGAGSFGSVAGLGNSDAYYNVLTRDLYANDIKSAFVMLFGSWLGDWAASDNILRAVLALPSYGLASAWSGRPHWFLQHMAMGETIGFGARLTMNNGSGGLYRNQFNTAAGHIHIGLMGDPALRMHIVAPPTDLRSTSASGSVTLNWSASADSVLGYHVYRASSAYGGFTRLTTSPVAATSFTDANPSGATNYMVRAVKLETSGSGTYYNPSIGAFLTSIDTGTRTDSGSTTNNPGIGSGGSTTNTPAPGATPTVVVYVDDALPAGAVTGSGGGDSWNWVSSNPAPYSGKVCALSSIGSGLHENYFSWAAQPLPVEKGDVLFTYVYVDPANPATELMLQWFNGSWEHRAYWGANNIPYGSSGTSSRAYMGPLPPAGQWTLLQVPASQVGLENSAVTGMAFSQFGGRAAWDKAGKASFSLTSTNNNSGGATTPPSAGNTSTNSAGGSTNTGFTIANAVTWVDDALPAGAITGSNGGDSWNWANSNPAPLSGNRHHMSSLGAGLHEHYFSWASQTLTVNPGEILFAHVYVDPNNPPSELMLQWNDGSWEHRAFWGADHIKYGAVGTSGRLYMGPIPPAGQWTLLQVPASKLGLEGSTLNGMAFSQYDGRASWDYVGKASSVVTNTTSTGGGTSTNPVAGTVTNFIPWVDDALPAGAVPGEEGGDSWDWITSNPAPFAGNLATISSIGNGLHQYFFSQATQTMPVNAGDVLAAYVYIDPANIPSELMLQWSDGTSWQHRAYWGANYISYGMPGTASRVYMGPVPPAGRWVLLQVPARTVELEGATVSGMAFSQYNGRAAWDYAGKFSVSANTSGGGSDGSITPPATQTNTPPATQTNLPPVTITNAPPPAETNLPPVTTNAPPATNSLLVESNSLPGSTAIDYITPRLPEIGDNSLRILTPTLLELKLINTKQPDPAPVAEWNFVDAGGNFTAPPTSAFTVLVNGSPVTVASVGFKRRPLYAPMIKYDLRIENSLYLQLAAPISDNQTVEVRNNNGVLWPSSKQFLATVDPLRYSPAVHVNQEGYMPNYAKKAMVGNYAGSLGEMTIPASAGFKIVDANTGTQVYQGSLTPRMDSGYTYTPKPYQKVYEADFTAFNTPGQYRLVVPGLGGSLPFKINDGVAMSFARAYALGIYHQRCGTDTVMPHTRFTHDVCHAAQVAVPASDSAYPFTWTTVAGYANTINQNNPPQIAPALTSPSAQLFPFVNQGPLDVTGGHHDAGDYSRYTVNSASMVHYLMFAVDSLPGVAALDNLGIPESGDGISDVLQEAKWEADFLAKMQDSDGGFYFLVYPENREYESNVTPEHGDRQVVWPKTTAVTAASVAALAQCASSAAFRQAYPAAAASYLAKAQLGWQFLMNAVNRYGKNGAYQKITHYGDNFVDSDELAWAACQMFLVTGDPSIHQTLLSWFDPADPATWRWGWWHMSEAYGHAIRSYAFAVQSGRANAGQLNATFLNKCQSQVAAAANDMLSFSQQNAYGSSFPINTKAVKAAGWYFSTDQAFDLAVAYALNPQQSYLNAMLENMNYEGGCNPVNVCYVTGLGWKRQRDIVSQWSLNDSRVLPHSGTPVGNIVSRFGYLWNYAGSLASLCFPSDDAATSPYPFYDRWGDSWNVNSEMVILNQARSMGTLGFLAAMTTYTTQPWKAPANAQIVVPSGITPVGSTITVSLQVPGMDVNNARVTWEARDQEPAFGSTFTFAPKNNGTQWVEAEAQWPDGRRVFAKASFDANAPNIVWVDDALPAGAIPGSLGGDSWNWVTANPAPYAGSRALQSSISIGVHQDYFVNASATMSIGAGDVLYAWVYLDPNNIPNEIMLQWNDGNWEHRAYWGANNLDYGVDGTSSRSYMGPLPTAGQWVQLRVPASRVNLEGRTVSGMAFTLHGGRAAWDAAGRVSSNSGVASANVHVDATAPLAQRTTATPGVFTFTRSGDTNLDLAINYTLSGTAVGGQDYVLSPPTGYLSSSLVIPAGATRVTLGVVPLSSTNFVAQDRQLLISLVPDSNYHLVNPYSAAVTVCGNIVPVKLSVSTSGSGLDWNSIPFRTYHVAYKNSLSDPEWTALTRVVATGATSSFFDATAAGRGQRFYIVAQVD